MENDALEEIVAKVSRVEPEDSKENISRKLLGNLMETHFVLMIQSPYVVKIKEELILIDDDSEELLSYICV